MSEDAKRRRSFPEAFKREAVAAVRGGRLVSQVATELGLADRLVHYWLRWAPGRGEPGRPGCRDRAAAQGARARADGA
jgi:transposase-like protein